jgi:hypothetical protein
VKDFAFTELFEEHPRFWQVLMKVIEYLFNVELPYLNVACFFMSIIALFASCQMESTRGCAYVRFATRNDAVDALENLCETRIGGVVPKVCFLRTTVSRSSAGSFFVVLKAKGADFL